MVACFTAQLTDRYKPEASRCSVFYPTASTDRTELDSVHRKDAHKENIWCFSTYRYLDEPDAFEGYQDVWRGKLATMMIMSMVNIALKQMLW